MGQESHRTAQVASGESGLLLSCEGNLRIPLKSLQGNRASSRVKVGKLGVPLQLYRNLGVPLEFQQGSQDLSHVEAWNSSFLLSCERGVRPLVEFRRVTWDFSRIATGESDVPSSCEGKLRVSFESLERNQFLSLVEGELGVLSTCGSMWIWRYLFSGNSGVRTPLELRWGSHVSS